MVVSDVPIMLTRVQEYVHCALFVFNRGCPSSFCNVCNDAFLISSTGHAWSTQQVENTRYQEHCCISVTFIRAHRRHQVTLYIITGGIVQSPPTSHQILTSSCGQEADVTMIQYYTITEGIVQRPPFNITPDLKL